MSSPSFWLIGPEGRPFRLESRDCLARGPVNEVFANSRLTASWMVFDRVEQQWLRVTEFAEPLIAVTMGLPWPPLGDGERYGTCCYVGSSEAVRWLRDRNIEVPPETDLSPPAPDLVSRECRRRAAEHADAVAVARLKARLIRTLDRALEEEEPSEDAETTLHRPSCPTEAAARPATREAEPPPGPRSEPTREHCLVRDGRAHCVRWMGSPMPLDKRFCQLLGAMLDEGSGRVPMRAVRDRVTCWRRREPKRKTIQNALTLVNEALEGVGFPWRVRFDHEGGFFERVPAER